MAIALSLLALSGCRSDPAANTVPTASTTRFSEEEREERAWDDLSMDHYRIVYRVAGHNGMGEPPPETFDLVVKNGEVTSCIVEDPTGRRTCNGYHTKAETFLWLHQFEPEFTEVSYDPVWHLPVRIDYDHPEHTDEEMTVDVLDFQPLDE